MIGRPDSRPCGPRGPRLREGGSSGATGALEQPRGGLGMGLAGQGLRAEGPRSVARGASETFARRRLYLCGEGGGERVRLLNSAPSGGGSPRLPPWPLPFPPSWGPSPARCEPES